MQECHGIDAGYHSSNIHPTDRESCVGKQGIDKMLTFDEVINLAFRMDNRPNIIVRGGNRAKWYFKRIPLDTLPYEVAKQEWRDTTRCTMYIIEWDDD